MPTDDEAVDAAPCPKCKAPLRVAAADLGYLIECPGCGTQSRARRADPPKGAPKPDDAPRRRDWGENDDRGGRDRDREEDDDRRDRRRPERDDGDEYAHRRRRPRRRPRDDDFDDAPPPRPGHGAAVGVAVMNFIFAALALLEGVCGGFVASMAFSEGRRGDFDAPFGSNNTAGLVFLGFGVCNLIAAALMVPSGIGLLTRRNYGRILGYLAAIFGLLNVLWFVILLIGFSGRMRDPESGFFFLIPAVIWVAYTVTVLILLSKVRRQPA
jgi:hypothetical protein